MGSERKMEREDIEVITNPSIGTIYGNVNDGRVTDPQYQFTWEEVEIYGTPLFRLRPGDRFVCVLAASKSGQGLATYTGRLEYPGIGSALVQINRNWESLIRWQPETKVIALPKEQNVITIEGLTEPQSGPRRVSLNPDNFEP